MDSIIRRGEGDVVWHFQFWDPLPRQAINRMASYVAHKNRCPLSALTHTGHGLPQAVGEHFGIAPSTIKHMDTSAKP